MDTALAVDAVFVITEALASLNVNQRRHVTRWSRGPPSRDCHVVDTIKPMLLGDVINDRLRRVSQIRNLAANLDCVGPAAGWTKT